GARIHVINPLDFDFAFEPASKSIVAPGALTATLLALAKAASDLGHLPQSGALAQAIAGRDAGEGARALVKALSEAGNAVLVLGETVVNARDAATLRAAARFVALATGSACNEIPSGANAIGLARAGVLPRDGGRDAGALLASP